MPTAFAGKHRSAVESTRTVVAALTDQILPLVPGLRDQLQAGIDMLDIGRGSGQADCAWAQICPHSRFVGYDLCDDAIAASTQPSYRSRKCSPNRKPAMFKYWIYWMPLVGTSAMVVLGYCPLLRLLSI